MTGPVLFDWMVGPFLCIGLKPWLVPDALLTGRTEHTVLVSCDVTDDVKLINRGLESIISNPEMITPNRIIALATVKSFGVKTLSNENFIPKEVMETVGGNFNTLILNGILSTWLADAKKQKISNPKLSPVIFKQAWTRLKKPGRHLVFVDKPEVLSELIPYMNIANLATEGSYDYENTGPLGEGVSFMSFKSKLTMTFME